MLYFTIPDSINQTALNIKLLTLIKTRPELFYNDFKINSVYGCPSGCIWNGGGSSMGSRMNKEIKLMFQKYKEFGVQYWLTFTNRLLKEEHMYDTYGNKVIEIGSEYDCGVLVANDIMEDYIRKNYANLKIIQSICRCEYSIEGLNKYSEKDLTVIPIRFNNDFEGTLKQFTHPENLEVLVNEPCIELCPYNKSHYESYNKFTLRESDTFWACAFPEQTDHSLLKCKKHYVSRDLFPKYEELGINHMKICGRNTGLDLIPTYVEMFVKPQYHELAELKLLEFDGRKDWCWEKEDLTYEVAKSFTN